MAKKKATARRTSGAAGIETVEDIVQTDNARQVEDAGGHHSEPNGKAAKPERKAKSKSEPQANGNFGVGEIRKAAAFANSIGGLDKAIALLQILKVAKEVQ